jgi:hypothetical protein
LRSVAILGADALLVALPSTPTQLANACFAGGFAEVFPATWGDELIAAGCLEQLEGRTGPAIFCSCPLVAEQLRGATELRRFIVPLISPPVAVARYLRALHPGDALRITYIGDCPGADDDSIDERLSPHELLDQLAKRGILPATQRPDLGAHAARDRRRFYSLPGGVPAPQWLSAQWPKRTLVDVQAGDALAGLANQTLSRGNTLIDFAPHLGCACAGAVGGTSAQDARKAVAAHEPPRAQSEIVSSAMRVEVSLAPTGERQPAEVSWNDFLAALPAALAIPGDGAHPQPRSEPITEPRRARSREKKMRLPRAYLAAKQVARRDRTGSVRARAAATPAIAGVPAVAPSVAVAPRGDSDISRRDEQNAQRPSAWVARRASHEGMTGPRNQPVRAGLSAADRWLLAGLMLAASVLVAVLTSALTVSGMQRVGAPLVAARVDTARTLANVPAPPAPSVAPVAAPSRAQDSAQSLAQKPAGDSVPQHEDAGTVGVPPATTTHRSPAATHATAPRRVATRVEHHPIAIAERAHATQAPPVASNAAVVRTPFTTPAAVPAPPPVTPQPVQQVVQQPVQQPAAAATSPAASPLTGGAQPSAVPAAATPAPAPASNAQFLEELRAIHAEIDARKRHMDSLSRSLDSLKKISPPR